MNEQLTQQHIEANRRLRVLTAERVQQAWEQLPSYDEDDVPAFLATVVPLVLASQRLIVALTNAFLARSVGRSPLPLDVPSLVGASVRNGATPEEVYRRPFVTVWTDLKAGTDWEDAVNAGLARATSAAEMDVQLSMRQTLVEVGEQDERIVGYRRVPDGDACALCLMASTQRYHTGELMPIHNRCGCGVEPLIGTEDPGRVIDRDLLRELKRSGKAGDLSFQQASSRARKRAAGNRDRAKDWRAEATAETDAKRRARLEERAANYDRRADAQEATAVEYARQRAERAGTRMAIREHGELGPLLVDGAHDFTSLA